MLCWDYYTEVVNSFLEYVTFLMFGRSLNGCVRDDTIIIANEGMKIAWVVGQGSL